MRRLWLVAAVQAIVAQPVFLVGGCAVDLHTGSYLPTDIDLVGAVGAADRVALVDAGFVDTGGRHLRWNSPDGSTALLESPESRLDGSFERIALTEDVAINVVTVENLIVDKVHQATDGSPVTFDEAVRDRADWTAVAADLASRPEAIYLDSVSVARDVLVGAGMGDIAVTYFGE